MTDFNFLFDLVPSISSDTFTPTYVVCVEMTRVINVQ